MIGFYDYTVIATYLSTVFGVCGIFFAMDKSDISAVVCLLIAGLLDAFDGRIARTKKNRSAAEKKFGIQIDSLNDLICFGALPSVIGYSLGGRAWWYTATLSFYVLAALIRLAYFNVTEEERQAQTDAHRRFYLGVPVTAVALLAPLLRILCIYTTMDACITYAVGLLVLGLLFITPLHIPKPGLAAICALAVIGVAEIIAILLVMMAL